MSVSCENYIDNVGEAAVVDGARRSLIRTGLCLVTRVNQIEGRRRPLPPCGLRDLHKCFVSRNVKAIDLVGQAAPAMGHGFGAWGFIVAVPTAQARGDTGEPRERALLVGVLLAFGFAFERLADSGDGLDLAFVDDVGSGARAAVAGVGELENARRRHEGESGEIEQPRSGFDLRALEGAQAVASGRRTREL